MGFGQPKSLTQCRRFFVEAQTPKQRAYEALRAYFVGEKVREMPIGVRLTSVRGNPG